MFPNQDHGRMTVSEEGSLIIDSVNKQDSGEYICKGLSAAGSAYAKAKLTVKGSYIVLVIVRSSFNVRLSWKNSKNGPQWDFGPPYLKNSPRIIDISVVFDKVDRVEFDPEEKTGNGSSFVRHFDEKPLKTAENRRKSVRVSRIRGPLKLGGPQRCPPLADPTPNTPSVC